MFMGLFDLAWLEGGAYTASSVPITIGLANVAATNTSAYQDVSLGMRQQQ